MAILGLGTDLAEIERFDKALQRSGDALAKRVLTNDEYATYLARKDKSRFLAKRFAAKEAASKALGTGIANGVTFQDFNIYNDEAGKPHLSLIDRAAELAGEMGANHLHLSISDERHYAVATVILES